jgi:hypothetical protein
MQERYKMDIIIIISISYSDMPAGAPVLLLLNTKETVPYRPDENLCLPLTAYSF